MLVRDIMHPNVFCVSKDMMAQALYLELVANGIAGAPVLDARDNLVGVVSLTDLARCAVGLRGGAASNYFRRSSGDSTQIKAQVIGPELRVKDIMNPSIHQLHYDSTVVEALDLMIEEDVHRAVVTHKGHVIGIVTSGDMMREFRHMLVGPDEDDDDGDDDDHHDDDDDHNDDDDDHNDDDDFEAEDELEDHGD